MSFAELTPSNPVELASIRAEQSTSDCFEMTQADEHLLRELDMAAEMLGFLDKQYFINSGRSMIIPKSFEATERVTYTNFFGLDFEGLFTCYSRVNIGRLVGGTSIRAVCMTFGQATLLPFFDPLPEDELLHVPVLAVNSITTT